jgi:hypothetical protein
MRKEFVIVVVITTIQQLTKAMKTLFRRHLQWHEVLVLMIGNSNYQKRSSYSNRTAVKRGSYSEQAPSSGYAQIDLDQK